VQPTPHAPNVIRFGLFEADLSIGELRKRGRKIPLQDQPFKVLALLLRSPGELVTREDLQASLWPCDSFGDFDDGLNKAIQKLRQALDDSTGAPRFIETIPRKGYRFIVPVDSTSGEATGARAESRRLGWREVVAWSLFALTFVGLALVTAAYLRHGPSEELIFFPL